MIRIYVIEDHFLIISGLKEILRSTPERIMITGYSNKVAEAIEQLHHHPVDIIVLDLFLQHTCAVSNIRKLKSEFPEIPVVILTMCNFLYWKIKMFKEGAQAYIVKDAPNDVIKNTIRFVHEGKTIIPPEVNSILESWKHDNLNHSLKCEDLDIVYDIFCRLNPKQIAFKYNKSLSSIEKTLATIRAKVNAKSNPDLIRIFFG
jgi:DNA-binding NarL/FixJ family response regulator